MVLAVRFIFRAILVGASAGFAAGVAATDLGQQLEVRMTQRGVVGDSGTAWTITPSGQWTRQDIVASQVRPVDPGDTGMLTQDKLARLREVLDKSAFMMLQERLGTPGRANPHRIVIRWGNKQVEMTTHAGVDPTQLSADAASTFSPQERQVATVARTVREMIAK